LSSKEQPKLVGDTVCLGVLGKPYVSSKIQELVSSRTTQVDGGYGLNGRARQTVCQVKNWIPTWGYGLLGSAN